MLLEATNKLVTSGALDYVKVGASALGIPGPVVDAVAGLYAKHLEDPKDQALLAEVTKIRQSIREAVDAQKEFYNDKRPPSDRDIDQGLARFTGEYQTAGDHKKRWILFNAFYNSLQPGFYDEGVSKILWTKVQVLEYPDLWFLRRVLNSLEMNPKRRNPAVPTLTTENTAVDEARKIRIASGAEEIEYAKRLVNQQLLGIIETKDHQFLIWPLGLARKMRDFAWATYWENANGGESEPDLTLPRKEPPSPDPVR